MRVFLSTLALLLAACGEDPIPPHESPGEPTKPTNLEVRANPAKAKLSAAIDANDLAKHIQILSSDEFEGRAPGSLGERLTLNYIENEFQRIGLLPVVTDGAPCRSFPCEGASYFQRVPMVSTTVDPRTTLRIRVGDQEQVLRLGQDMVIGSRSEQPEVTIENSDLVFVGYGVVAPEKNWNDYAGLDVRGKTVIILVNDPGFLRGDETLFKGRAMTYYGRWTYKFEEAARQGAAAALIVHDELPAGYGWDVVVNSWSGKQHDLPRSGDPEPRLMAQGWISLEAATALFAADGKDFSTLRLAADRPGFQAVPLRATLTTTIRSVIENQVSYNAVAILPGSERPEESVLYMAHWDHLGRKEGPDHDDPIFNGAIDNATGVAGVLEIAHAFAALEPRPKRSVVILFPTLEESGLLGSKYFVSHPPVSLVKMAAVINLDALPIRGRNLDMNMIGQGQSKDLDQLLEQLLAAQNRILAPETSPEKGFFFRSDHFNFVRLGVPALYARAGLTHIVRGAEYGRKWAEDYTANRYHKPTDEFDPNWDYAGILEDLNLYFEAGKRLLEPGVWPNWSEDSEFRAAREASAMERTQ